MNCSQTTLEPTINMSSTYNQNVNISLLKIHGSDLKFINVKYVIILNMFM